MRVSELPARLRHYGLTVVEVAGWQTRGKEFPDRPDGALRHWTAGPVKGETPSLRVVTIGRSDLAGPLCQVYQARKPDPRTGLDVVYLVASGVANHAGAGSWNGISGNSNLLGVEIEWSGPAERFGPNRVLTSELVMRALLDCCAGSNPNDAAEHREYAKPPGRKIDTNLDGNVLRRRMRELAVPVPPTPPKPTPPKPDPTPEPPEDPEMPAAQPFRFYRFSDHKDVFVVPVGHHARVLVPDQVALEGHRQALYLEALVAGTVDVWKGDVLVVERAAPLGVMLASIPVSGAGD